GSAALRRTARYLLPGTPQGSADLRQTAAPGAPVERSSTTTQFSYRSPFVMGAPNGPHLKRPTRINPSQELPGVCLAKISSACSRRLSARVEVVQTAHLRFGRSL